MADADSSSGDNLASDAVRYAKSYGKGQEYKAHLAFTSRGVALRKQMAELIESLNSIVEAPTAAWFPDLVGSTIREMNEISSTELENPLRVALYGDAGQGKSTLLNMVLGVKEAARTSNSTSSCSKVIIEYSKPFAWQRHDMGVEITLMDEDEIESRIRELVQAFMQAHKPSNSSSTTTTSLMGTDSILGAIHGLLRGSDDENFKDLASLKLGLLDDSIHEQLVESIISNSQNLVASTKKGLVFPISLPAEPSIRLQQFSRLMNGEYVQFWPIVKLIKIGIQHVQILKHVTFIDLPGTNDVNSIVQHNAAKKILDGSDCIWVVTELRRSLAKQTNMMALKESLRRGRQDVVLVCTRAELSIQDVDHVMSDLKDGHHKTQLAEALHHVRQLREELKRHPRGSSSRTEMEEALSSQESKTVMIAMNINESCMRQQALAQSNLTGDNVNRFWAMTTSKELCWGLSKSSTDRERFAAGPARLRSRLYGILSERFCSAFVKQTVLATTLQDLLRTAMKRPGPEMAKEMGNIFVNLSKELQQLKPKLRGDTDNVLQSHVDSIDARSDEFQDYAQRESEKWDLLPYPTLNAICRKNGCHEANPNTDRAEKHNWCIQLTEPLYPVLENKGIEMLVTSIIDKYVSKAKMLFDTRLQQQKTLLPPYEDVESEPDVWLVASFNSNMHFQKDCDLIKQKVNETIDDIHAQMTSDCKDSFVLEFLRPTLDRNGDEHGTGALKRSQNRLIKKMGRNPNKLPSLNLIPFIIDRARDELDRLSIDVHDGFAHAMEAARARLHHYFGVQDQSTLMQHASRSIKSMKEMLDVVSPDVVDFRAFQDDAEKEAAGQHAEEVVPDV